MEENIEFIYHTWTICIQVYLDQVKKDYFEKHDILEVEIDLNNIYTFNDFIKELEKQTTLEEEIEKETEEYQLYAGYNEIENVIRIIKEEYKQKIKQNKKEKDKLLQQIHQEIKKRFYVYYEDKKKWQKLINYLNTDQVSLEELNQIKELQKFIGSSQFTPKYNNWIYLVNKGEFKEKENEIQIIYNQLYKKAWQEIEKLTFNTKDLGKNYKINNILQNILSIIERAKNGGIEYEKLKALKDITFIDFKNDAEILFSLRPIIRKQDIYVAKDWSNANDYDQIRWLQIENNSHYVYSYQPGMAPEIEKSEYSDPEYFKKDHISLCNFLAQATPSFYEISYGPCFYTYKKDSKETYYCYLEEIDEDVSVAIQLLSNIIIEKTGNLNPKYTKFKDKEYLIETIVNQINYWQEHEIQNDLERKLIRK